MRDSQARAERIARLAIARLGVAAATCFGSAAAAATGLNRRAGLLLLLSGLAELRLELGARRFVFGAGERALQLFFALLRLVERVFEALGFGLGGRDASLIGGALFGALVGGALERQASAHNRDQQHADGDADGELQALLALIAPERRELLLVRLLRRQRFHARLVLGLGFGLFDFGLTDALETRRLFFAAHLLEAARFFFFPNTPFFCVARGALGSGLRLSFLTSPTVFVGLLLLDAIFLEVH